MISVLILLTEFSICSLLKTLGINPISDSLAILLIIVFSAAFLTDIQIGPVLKKYNAGLGLGYLLRIALLLFDRYGKSIYRLPNSGADSEWFYQLAVEQSTGISSHKSGDFIALFRIIFSIIGTNRLFGQFIVVLFSIVSLCFLAMTIEKFHIQDENKIKTVTLVCLLPNFAILSSIFLRESIVAMFVSISFYYFMKYYRKESIITIIFAYFFAATGAYFHAGVSGLMIGYAIVLLLHDRENDLNMMHFQNIILVFVVIFVVLFLYFNYGNIFFAKFMDVDKLSEIANISNTGGSSYAAYVGNSSSVQNMIIFTIPRYMFFLYSPFPFQWRGLKDIIAFLFSGLYYFYITVISLHCVFKTHSRNRTLIINILIVLLCVLFPFAWGVAASGTAARHRDKLITIFAVLHALCRNMISEKENIITRVRNNS